MFVDSWMFSTQLLEGRGSRPLERVLNVFAIWGLSFSSRWESRSNRRQSTTTDGATPGTRLSPSRDSFLSNNKRVPIAIPSSHWRVNVTSSEWRRGGRTNNQHYSMALCCNESRNASTAAVDRYSIYTTRRRESISCCSLGSRQDASTISRRLPFLLLLCCSSRRRSNWAVGLVLL